MENKKLDQFRKLLDGVNGAVQGCPVDAYLLPRTDAHQNEYISERDSRVRFISGFSGSNAFAVITKSDALLWTDGRYFIQAKNELEPGWKLMEEGLPNSITPTKWILKNLAANSRVGFDPELCGIRMAKTIESLNHAHITAVPLKPNLVDLIWTDRPDETINKVIAVPESEAGLSSPDKIEMVRKELSKSKCDAGVFSALDEIAWLLNIRGSDIPYNPLVFAVVILTPSEVHLFIDERKLTDEVRAHLQHVILHKYSEASDWLRLWIQQEKANNKTHSIFIPESINFELGTLVQKADGYCGTSPIYVLKAVKNSSELKGTRASHIRDSAAIVRFLVWLQNEIAEGRKVTELSAIEKIESFRAEEIGFVCPSFATISAVDDHAALPHYKPTDESGTREITNKSIYLIDSGGQYRDGTTDVTRTVSFSEQINPDIKRLFTLVLKGHIDTALLTFPEGVNGMRLDAFSRQHLWADGLDFSHGVGHGVGHFLNVHEGPVGIGYRRYSAEAGVKRGMVITIEPGYYLEGHYGIRIENCYEVVQKANLRSGTSDFNGFQTLTYVPIQKSLIEKSLLTCQEVEWLNKYHDECLSKLLPLFEERGWKKEAEWLKESCKQL